MTIKTILSCVILSTFITPVSLCKYNRLFQSSKAPAKPSYPVPGKLVKNMDESELQQVLAYAKEIKDTELTFKVFFYLISQSKSQEALQNYKLDYADFTFGLEDYEKSVLAYEEFIMLYPGSKQAEYANYKAILGNFLLSLSFDRDQTMTQRTLSSCLLFLQKAKDEKFINETKNIFKSCRQRLFEHEVYVLETYLKQCKLSGAQTRIDYIAKEFADFEHIQEYIAYFNKMLSTVKDPKTRPFLINLNLKHALIQKEEQQPSASTFKRLTSFFLA